MALTYTWKITSLVCQPRVSGRDNVVCTVRWHCAVTDPDRPDIVADHADSTDITPSYSGTFTPFESLTEEQVLSWVHAELAPILQSLHEALAEKWRVMSLPRIVELPVPWAN